MSRLYSIEHWNYEVDEQRLEKIRKEVLEKFSYVKHVSLKVTDSRKIDELMNEKYIKNVKVTNVNNSGDFKEYSVELDRIKVPYIVSVIDKILDGDIDAIKSVIYLNCDQEYEIVKSTIEKEMMLLESKKELTKEEKEKLEDLKKQSGSVKSEDNIKKYYVYLKRSIGPVRVKERKR